MSHVLNAATTLNGMSTPSSTNLDVTNDVDLMVRWKPVSFTASSANRWLIGRRQTPSTFSQIYGLYVSSSDVLTFVWTQADDTDQSEITTAALSTVFDAGDIAWIRATLDVDNGAADAEVKFYWSKSNTNDPAAVSWTQLGATVMVGATTDIIDARTSKLEIGALDETVAWNTEGRFYRGVVKDGIAGTVIFDADTTEISVTSGQDAETFTELSANAATVTIHGTAWTYVDTTAAVTGTAVTGGVLESEIVTGGETIVLTLTNDTWEDTVGDDNAITDALIAGIDSGGVEAAGWDAEVKGNMVFGDVARTSDTVVTVTLAAEAAYAITANETITATIPATAIVSSGEETGAPTFAVTNEATGIASAMLLLGVG